MYGGAEIIQFGTILIPCQHKGKEFNCVFYVTNALGPAIYPGNKTIKYNFALG
jgi:hypothetical protein